MDSELKKGVIDGFTIYAVGIFVTLVVHLIYGWANMHSPPASAIPAFITLIVGSYRLLSTALKTFAQQSQQAKGELFVHIGAALLLLAFIRMSMN
jgi:hypothetical protein